LTVNRTQEKIPKKQQIRNIEYYDLQQIFDKLYDMAKRGKIFTNLTDIINSENNILLAYRNIKKNKGSTTAGVDKKNITEYENWTEMEFIAYFQAKLANYKPKPVRRVEIPKPHDPTKTRPLGIPCMDDRIIQQAILQVLDPICEARFHNHSYGFRPNRTTSHAIARTKFLMSKNKLHYVVDIDIKGFFDNVNHAKLLKQLWTLGVQDKSLISIIGRMLKSDIDGVGKPTKGTPQGGIISPLLSNVVLNELDWWLSDQFETFKTKYQYKLKRSDCNNRITAIKKSNLKEFFAVRYADDFKILCRDFDTAKRIYKATQMWLKERLGLEISPEKSKITNVKKNATEFLGFAIKVKKKRGKWVTKSHILKKAKKAIINKLSTQIKNTTPQQVNKLNSQILGVHNHYKIATEVSLDMNKINFIVAKSLYNRVTKNTKVVRGKKRKKHPPPQALTKTYKELYGEYKGKLNIVAGIAIFPIYGQKFKAPMNFTQETSKYTEKGREFIHKNLKDGTTAIINYLLLQKEYDKSVEYNDNRISLMSAQRGKCGITGEYLQIDNMNCHHKLPKQHGGTDEYKNLIWISGHAHKLIHATQSDTIRRYLTKLNLDDKGLKKVNSLRLLAGNQELVRE